jgi:hypothetical protein
MRQKKWNETMKETMKETRKWNARIRRKMK